MRALQDVWTIPCHDSPRSPQTPFSSLGSRCDARGVFCVYPPVSQHSRSRASCGPEKDVIKFVLPFSSRSLIFWLPTPLASPRWPCPLQRTRCSRPMGLGLNLQEPWVPNLDRRPFGQGLRRCVHPNHPSSTVRSGLSGSGLIHAQGERTWPPRLAVPLSDTLIRETPPLKNWNCLTQGFIFIFMARIQIKVSNSLSR